MTPEEFKARDDSILTLAQAWPQDFAHRVYEVLYFMGHRIDRPVAMRKPEPEHQAE